MIGVDTNIIVRLLTGDDLAQAAKAKTFFKAASVFIPETVMLEAEWVLRHAYDFTPESIHDAFMGLCGLPNVTLANPHTMMTALQWYGEGMDFGDALHLAQSQACASFVSFDRKFAQKAAGKGRCKVRIP
jgi:predicted nucleic-acid-binding protein